MVIFVGTGRSGKTSSCWSLMSDPEIWGDRPKAGFMYPTELAQARGMRSISRLDDLEPGELLFFDDSALNLLADGKRNDFMKNWLRKVTIISHNEQVCLLTIQNLQLLDKGTFESQFVWIFQKYSDWNNVALEREAYAERLMIGNYMLEKLKETIEPDQSIKSYAYDHKNGRFLHIDYPAWFDSEKARGLNYSKPYRGLKLGC